MKKFSLMMGALGGAMAGYLLSNEKLREELVKAKKPEDAAKVLGKHLQKDGGKMVKDVQAFVKSDDVQKNFTKAKQFAQSKFIEAKDGVEKMMKQGEKMVGKGAKSMAGMVKKGKSSEKKTMKKAEFKGKDV